MKYGKVLIYAELRNTRRPGFLQCSGRVPVNARSGNDFPYDDQEMFLRCRERNTAKIHLVGAVWRQSFFAVHPPRLVKYQNSSSVILSIFEVDTWLLGVHREKYHDSPNDVLRSF